MAKVSKYEKMIGQVVSTSFADVKVTGYRNPKVTSKTGRTYRKYEVEIDNMLWVSTTSFKNQSFSKRYFKALKEKPVSEPVDELYDLKTTYDLKELKKIYRTLSKKFHPDNLDTGNSEKFKEIKTIYDIRKLALEANAEFNEDSDFKEMVDMTEEALKAKEGIQYNNKPTKPVNEPAMYYPAVISEKPISADTIKKHVNKLENTFYYKDLRKVFNGLANIYHPDKGGNAKLFQEFYETYNRQAKVLKRAEDILLTRISGQEYEDTVKGLYELQRQKEEIYGC